MATQTTRCCFGLLAVLLLLATSCWSAQGDPLHGKALYVGNAGFVNGGAPCIACHALVGLDLAGSASYGPDLSQLYSDYEAEGVLAVLESLAFPSMEAIYADRPLTEPERLDLTAYFAKTSELSAPEKKSLIGPIFLGVVAVFAVVGIAGLRRLNGVRQPLVEQARKQRGINA